MFVVQTVVQELSVSFVGQLLDLVSDSPIFSVHVEKFDNVSDIYICCVGRVYPGKLESTFFPCHVRPVLQFKPVKSLVAIDDHSL